MFIQFDDEKIVSGSYDKSVRVWDLDRLREGKKPTVISKLLGHREFVGTLRMDHVNIVRSPCLAHMLTRSAFS